MLSIICENAFLTFVPGIKHVYNYDVLVTWVSLFRFEVDLNQIFIGKQKMYRIEFELPYFETSLGAELYCLVLVPDVLRH